MWVHNLIWLNSSTWTYKSLTIRTSRSKYTHNNCDLPLSFFLSPLSRSSYNRSTHIYMLNNIMIISRSSDHLLPYYYLIVKVYQYLLSWSIFYKIICDCLFNSQLCKTRLIWVVIRLSTCTRTLFQANFILLGS